MLNARVFLAGATVVLLGLAAAAAGWWFLVRADADLATSAPDIPQDLVEATETPDAADSVAIPTAPSEALAFAVVGARSEAAYFVNEELASVGLPSTAKGTTTAVEGTFYLTGDGTALASDTPTQLTVDLSGLTSDKSMRDQRVQEALETFQYPTATFTVASASGYDPSIPEGDEQSLQLTGTLELHGVQREVTWEVKARREGNVITALATLTVNFADFNITAPTFFDIVSIDDKATLQVQLVAQAV
jgi:polyisoprenoid-binding protein YceI